MLATEHLDPHDSHCKKNRRVSFCRSVSGERQVWHVTYSLIYLHFEAMKNTNLQNGRHCNNVENRKEIFTVAKRSRFASTGNDL